jgi:methyl-accepting chemotaxis protein
MRGFQRLGVRHKHLLLIAVVLLAFLGSHAIQVRTLVRYRVGGEAHQSLRRLEETHELLQGLLAELGASRADLALLLAPASEDQGRQLQQRWEETAAAVEVRFARALAAADEERTRLLLTDAQAGWAEYVRTVREGILPTPPAERQAALRAFMDGPQTRRQARWVELLEAAANAVRLRSTELERQVLANIQRTQLLLAVVGGVLTLLLAAFLVVLTRSIGRPLRALVAGARRVEEGDLSVAFDTSGGDELGQLSRSLGQMVAHLRELLLSMREAGTQLGQAVERMSQTAEAQGQSVELQSFALRQAQQTAEDIRRMSESAARQAAEVLAVAERADEVGRAGGDALGASIEGIEGIRRQMEEIARRVVELGQRSVQVAAITHTVKGLADQSNLLAVNAAIEAVRAGEAGKGFAVVAREIRGLADQSVRATNEVHKKLQETSSAVETTVHITGQGQARMVAGLAQVRASGERLEELTRMLQDSSAGVRQIASAVERQHQGLGQIFLAVQDLSRTTEQALEGVEAARRGATELREVTARLTGTLAGFRL